jgi:hypothetical protein
LFVFTAKLPVTPSVPSTDVPAVEEPMFTAFAFVPPMLIALAFPASIENVPLAGPVIVPAWLIVITLEPFTRSWTRLPLYDAPVST